MKGSYWWKCEVRRRKETRRTLTKLPKHLDVHPHTTFYSSILWTPRITEFGQTLGRALPKPLTYPSWVVLYICGPVPEAGSSFSAIRAGDALWATALSTAWERTHRAARRRARHHVIHTYSPRQSLILLGRIPFQVWRQRSINPLMMKPEAKPC